jgi:hypothetical protein
MRYKLRSSIACGLITSFPFLVILYFTLKCHHGLWCTGLLNPLISSKYGFSMTPCERLLSLVRFIPHDAPHWLHSWGCWREAKPGSSLRYNICCMSVRRRYVSFSTWWRQGTDSRSQRCSTSIMMLAKVVILLGAYWPTAHVILTALHAGRWCVRQHGEDGKCEVCSKRHILGTYSLWRHVSGLEEGLIVTIRYAQTAPRVISIL